MSHAIGIDIHKASLVVAVHNGDRWTARNTPAGVGKLIDELHGRAPGVIVVEPSGGYERPLIAALHAAALPVSRVNPRHIRHYAQAGKIQAKTDPLDAQVLASYGAVMTPPLTPAPTPATTRLAALTTRRRQLREIGAAEKRRRATVDAEVRASIDRHVAFLDTEVATLEAEISALVESDPGLCRARTILLSVPSIGRTTAHLLLAELSELGTINAKRLASLVGVAPFDKQSGAGAGTAHIAGGRRHVRSGLWMPTISAMNKNPVIKTFGDRLKADHKPQKVVTISCMRKLLTILNAMLANDEEWSPRVSNP